MAVNPYYDPLDAFDPRNNAYAARSGFQMPPLADPADPGVPLAPGDERGVLGRLMEESLGGLAYLGKVLDKTFGGRAARGVLGGRPEELLSVLPMSDTLGLTNEKNVVHGTDLLADLGVINRDDTGWQNQIAGMVAEIGLDPGMWFGAAVPKFVMGNLGKGAGAVGRNVLQPASARLGRATGVDPYAAAQGLAQTGRRQVKAMFNTPTQGATSAEGQKLMEEFYTPTLRGRQQAAKDTRAQLLEPLLQYIDRGQDAERALFTGMLQHVEGYGPEALQTLSRHFNPAEVQQITGWAGQHAGRMRNLLGPEQARGIATGELMDPLRNPLALTPEESTQIMSVGVLDPAYQKQLRDKLQASQSAPTVGAEYFPRQINPLGKTTEEGTLDFLRRSYRQFKGEHDFAEHRLDELRGLPGGTATWNSLVKDPRLSGQTRTMSDLQVEDYLQKLLRGTSTVHVGDDAILKQAKAMSEKLKGLTGDYVNQKKDYFSLDFTNNAFQREMASAKATTAADTAQKAIADLGKPEAFFKANGIQSYPVNDLLHRMGLVGTDPNGVSIARQQAANALGVHIDDLAGMHIPADVAADMLRVGEAWKTPGMMTPVIQAWDYLTNLFKTWVTAPFPAFHTRNIMSGLFNQWRDGALSLNTIQEVSQMQRGGSMSAQTAAKLYGAGVSPEQASHMLVQEAIAHDVAFNRINRGVGDTVGSAMPGGRILAEDLPRVGGQAGTFVEGAKSHLSNLDRVPGESWARSYGDVRRVAGAATPEDVHPVIKTARAIGSTAEDNIRLSHYLSLRQQGIPPTDAAMRVKKYQIDYGDLTSFERNVMKRVMPWYCVPTDHEILTRRGWKFHHELQLGEDVLAYNYIDQTLHWTPLEAVQEFDYDGMLMEYECRGASFRFTHNHRWPVESMRSFVKGKWYGGNRDIREADEINKNHRIPLTGNFSETRSALSPRHAAILGWLVTDGHIRFRGGSCEMVVYQSEKKFAKEVQELLGVEPRPATDDRSGTPVLTFAVAACDRNEILAVYKTASDLPKIASRLSHQAAEAMYEAMMMAEGTEAATGQEHFAQDKDLNQEVIDAFQIVCVLTGRMAFQSGRGCYVRRTAHIYPKHWQRPDSHYAGKIWCPKTAYGTWVMRHNGAIAITGNTFSRKNLPPILEDLASKPGKLLATTRAVTGSRPQDEFIPGFIAEGASVPVPGAPEGEQRFISSFGLPIEDEALKTIGSLLQGDTQRTLQQMIGMSQPVVKLPFEVATGTQMFSGRKLEELRPYESLLGLGLPEDVARKVTQVVANTPASRAASTFDKFIDERKGTIPTAINTLTGVRFQDVDMQRQQDYASRKLLQDMLLGMPGVRSSTDVYIPQATLPELDPYQLQLYNLLKRTDAAIDRKAREEKKAAGR